MGISIRLPPQKSNLQKKIKIFIKNFKKGLNSIRYMEIISTKRNAQFMKFCIEFTRPLTIYSR